jgi:hypothetical protein
MEPKGLFAAVGGTTREGAQRVRVIFAGRSNAFNAGIAQWLAKDHEVVACLFLEPNRQTTAMMWKRIKLRAKKYGWIKAIDEVLFHALDRVVIRRHERPRLLREFPPAFTTTRSLDIPSHSVNNIHARKWLDFVTEAKPDIIFSVCGSVIFRPELYTIPRFGTLVLHEGLTPEYKGLHTPLWALMNKEHDYLGYTLLKVDDSIDGGAVLSQRSYELGSGESFRTWSLVAHKAILANLDHIAASLSRLEADGGFEPLDITGRRHQYFTWMGLSDFLRLYLRNFVIGRQLRGPNHRASASAESTTREST